MSPALKMLAMVAASGLVSADHHPWKKMWMGDEHVQGGCTCENPYCCPSGWPCENHNPSVCCPPETPVICSEGSCCESGFTCCDGYCCFAAAASTNATDADTRQGKRVTTTYYADKECKTVGGGPPGLISNPFTSNIGECEKLMSIGYAVVATACGDGSSAESDVYPFGCGGKKGDHYSVKEGVCVETQGVYSITEC